MRPVLASTRTHSTLPSRGISERITHAAHWFLLPLVGIAAAAIGGLVLLGVLAPQLPYLPWALLGFGVAALATSLAFHHWRGQIRGPRSPESPPGESIGSVPHGPSPAVLGGWPKTSEIFPHSGLGRAALTAASGAGERIWTQWQTGAPGRLGATLAGPVSETAYVPNGRAHPSPYSYRDHDLYLTPPYANPAGALPSEPTWYVPTPAPAPVAAFSRSTATGRSRSSGRRGVPYSEEELDALFPPDARGGALGPTVPLATAEVSPIPLSRPALAVEADAVRSAGLGPSPTSPGAPYVFTLPVPTDDARTAAVRELPSGRFRILPTLLHLHDRLYVESIHPIPPHLRAARRTRSKSGPAPPAGHPSSTRPLACVGCLRSLTGFRAWVICPGCHHPLCRRCLGASFLASSEGYCSQCRPWHGRTAS